MFLKRMRGQTFIEYTIFIGILVTVLVAMTPMMRRGIQAMVKLASDRVGTQENSEQTGARFGKLINSTTYTEAQQNIEMGERLGVTGKEYDTDRVFTRTTTYLNQGFGATGD